MQFVCYVLSFHKEGETKKYFGSTYNFDQRVKSHLRMLSQNDHHNSRMQKLWLDGWVLGKDIISYPVLTRKAALLLEKAFILGADGDDSVINIECGHDTFTRNPNKNDYVDKLINHLKSYRENLSPEEYVRYCLNKSGEKNGMFGRTHTPEARAVISEKVKAFNKKYGSPLKGRKASLATREKLSKIASQKTGDKNPFFGKKHSEKTRQNIAAKNRGNIPKNARKVLIEGIEYISITEAGRRLGVHTTVVLWRINNVTSPRFSEWKWLEMPND